MGERNRARPTAGGLFRFPSHGAAMQPYYSDSHVTIYHGDCREVLPTLGRGLVHTDPPYGIRADEAAAKNKGKWGWKFHGNTEWDRNRPNRETFDAILAAADGAVIWGGNYFADLLPPSMGWLVWDKGQKDFSCADFEMAWSSFWAAGRRIHFPRGAAPADGRWHPTQKPLEVCRWAIVWATERGGGDTIFDPFMGSGSTLRAAKDLNRRAIGIEIEERYCEIAAERCRQEVLDFGGTA